MATKKTAAQLVAYAKSMVGRPYWYGTYGNKASVSLLNAKTKQYPSLSPSGASPKWTSS